MRETKSPPLFFTCQITNLWPRTTSLTSKLFFIRFANGFGRLKDYIILIHWYLLRYIRTYILTLFSTMQKHVKSTIFGVKRQDLHQNLSTIDIQTIQDGLNVIQFIFMDIYIDRYRHKCIHYSLWCKFMQIRQFWPETTSLTSEFIYNLFR